MSSDADDDVASQSTPATMTSPIPSLSGTSPHLSRSSMTPLSLQSPQRLTSRQMATSARQSVTSSDDTHVAPTRLPMSSPVKETSRDVQFPAGTPSSTEPLAQPSETPRSAMESEASAPQSQEVKHKRTIPPFNVLRNEHEPITWNPAMHDKKYGKSLERLRKVQGCRTTYEWSAESRTD